MAAPGLRAFTPGTSTPDLGQYEQERGQRNCDLSSDVWERLPETLIERILAKLSFSDLLRFCRVCKGWRNSILSSKITPICSSSALCLFYFHMGQLNMLNSRTVVWEPVSLHFLLVTQVTLVDVVASAGGLLCFTTDAFGKFIVCNPVTKRYKIIPMPHQKEPVDSQQAIMPTPHYWPERRFASSRLQAGMVLTSDPGHFKLIVIGLSPGSRRTTLVYDSRADSWEKVPPVPEFDLGFSSWKHNLIACDGNLFFLWNSYDHDHKLLKYSVDQKNWSCIPMPSLEELGCPMYNTLIEQHGNLIFLANPVRRKVVFLEFQGSGNKLWLPANPSPRNRIGEAIRDLCSIECVGQGDVVFFIQRKRGSKHISLNAAWRVGIHKLDKSNVLFSWSRWQPHACHGTERFQVFEPSLLQLESAGLHGGLSIVRTIWLLSY